MRGVLAANPKRQASVLLHPARWVQDAAFSRRDLATRNRLRLAGRQVVGVAER